MVSSDEHLSHVDDVWLDAVSTMSKHQSRTAYIAQVFKDVILDLESVDLAEKLCWLQFGSMIRSSLR